ncbi:beta-lactamase family protein [Paenibacillus rhizovicinus]|uniref:Beta-lactamase family protein n=2 Tax=Paenibacillus rhizovicinus TaxID=2704463 RepID=A0A6C0P8S8_9BACL|nr:beta-lactamase family protein [Paenibacillus rhizovicinus]
MGIDEERLEAAWRLLDSEVEQGRIPGGTVLVLRRGMTAAHAAGYSLIDGETRISATADTVYDCASLTKVVVTLPLVLQLIEQGMLALGDRVSAYFPAFSANGKGEVTVRQLLTHTSGMAAYRDFYSHGLAPDEIMAAICADPLVCEPGTKVVYSCLGYIVLGRLVSQLLGMSLDRAAENLIFRPLGMTSSCFNPPESWKPHIAATEYDPALGTFRWGRVHDENAYALGGVSGNAGLFSTAADLARCAAVWLDRGGFLISRAAVEAALRNDTIHLAGAARGLGWVLHGDPRDASGDLLSARSYGHTGFTGTSLCIDPARDLAVILLTNKVHFGRGRSIAGFAARVHNAIAASLTD